MNETLLPGTALKTVTKTEPAAFQERSFPRVRRARTRDGGSLSVMHAENLNRDLTVRS